MYLMCYLFYGCCCCVCVLCCMCGSVLSVVLMFVFFFKQKAAYEVRISDWSSDVCSSDLPVEVGGNVVVVEPLVGQFGNQITKAQGILGLKISTAVQIGRASGRGSVCQYV